MAQDKQALTWKPASATETTQPPEEEPLEAGPDGPGKDKTTWRPGPVTTHSSTKFRSASSSNNTTD